MDIGALEYHPAALSATTSLVGSATSDILIAQTANTSVNAGAGDDVVVSAIGRQVITLGVGRDVLVWAYYPDSDIVNDFAPGDDRLDLRKLLQTVGYAGTDPLASGHVTCANAAGGAIIRLDRDGSVGSAYAPVSYAYVKGTGVSASSLCRVGSFLY